MQAAVDILSNNLTNVNNESNNNYNTLSNTLNALEENITSIIDSSLVDINNDITNINTDLNNMNRICIGSQVLYSSINGSGAKGKTSFMGAYGDGLIRGIFNGITVPSGWHKEFRITYQATNSGSGVVRVYLNNIQCGSGIGTWSGTTFRILEGSNFFRDSDVTQVATHNYTATKGMNLYYESTTAEAWTIYNITLHGYLVKGA